MWKLPNERERLDNLESIARKLLHDKDKDVFDLAQKAILQMDAIKSFLTVTIRYYFMFFFIDLMFNRRFLTKKNEVDEQVDRLRENEENYLNEQESKKVKSSFRISGKCQTIGGPG